MIDPDTADEQHFNVGDTIKVAGDGPVRAFTIDRHRQVRRRQQPRRRHDRPLRRRDGAQRARASRASTLSPSPPRQAASARTGCSTAIARALPDSREVKTGAEQATEDGKGVGEFVTFIRFFLLGFGGIALFVGAFVIFNTLSITVAQRTQELATLRTLGASRRQVLRSVVLEGLVLGARRVGRRPRARRAAREGADGRSSGPSTSSCRRRPWSSRRARPSRRC